MAAQGLASPSLGSTSELSLNTSIQSRQQGMDTGPSIWTHRRWMMLVGIGGAIEFEKVKSSLAQNSGGIDDPGKGPNPSPTATYWPANSPQQWVEPKL